MTKLKICGLMSAEDAQYVNAARPDYAGMILSAGYRRTVSEETAGAIRNALDTSVPAVGVFVNAQISDILRFAEKGVIQAVQLHGTESAQYLRELRAVCALPVIRAFRVQSEADIRDAEQSEADMILLDSGAGTGKPFDWSLLAGMTRPYFLAGGISPENAADVMARFRPFGIDVSSGVETDGRKDGNKIMRIAQITREDAI